MEEPLNETPGGSMTTIEHWYAEYHSRLYARALSMLGNHEDAQDVMQQSWLKAWIHQDAYAYGSNPLTWLYAIVTRTAIDALRNRTARLACMPWTLEGLMETNERDAVDREDVCAENPLDIVVRHERIQTAWGKLAEQHRKEFRSLWNTPNRHPGPETSSEKTRRLRARNAFRMLCAEQEEVSA